MKNNIYFLRKVRIALCLLAIVCFAGSFMSSCGKDEEIEEPINEEPIAAPEDKNTSDDNNNPPQEPVLIGYRVKVLLAYGATEMEGCRLEKYLNGVLASDINYMITNTSTLTVKTYHGSTLIGSTNTPIEAKDGYTVLVKFYNKNRQLIDSGIAEVTAVYVQPTEVEEDISVTEEPYVDLGLSVKWGARNVGAEKVSDDGLYIAWGEIENKSDYTAYSHRQKDNSSFMALLNVSSGICGTSYDVATHHLGQGWRLPTSSEMRELVNNCSFKWTTSNGKAGCLLTSKITGSSIFLPASGYRYSTSTDSWGFYGNTGYYWTGSNNTVGKLEPVSLVFTNDSYQIGTNGHNYYDGHSVRGVYTGK